MDGYITGFRDGHQQDDTDTETMGGKASNLLQMSAAGFPVPEGFVLTTGAYREFLERSGIRSELVEVANVDDDSQTSVEEAAAEARRLITEATMPPEIADRIRSAYADLDAEAVAVRSSATAEDLADASFAGQQETFLDVKTAEDVVRRVQDCWASLFTERAVTYRLDKGFPIEDLAIAVVVQRMVPAEKSGVLFTADPNTGADRVIVEAALGLGEAVVSGETSPDNYVLDKETGELLSKTVNTQEYMSVRSPDGEATLEEVPAEDRTERVLEDDELAALLSLGREVEAHYEQPQDVEWSLVDGQVFLLQTRPITSIGDHEEEAAARVDGEALMSGLGASSGSATGRVCFDPIRAVKRSDEDVILVRETTSPSDVPGMKAAEGIVTNKGGTTSHAAIVARELGKPAVVGCGAMDIDYDRREAELDGTTLTEDDELHVDGSNGRVERVD